MRYDLDMFNSFLYVKETWWQKKGLRYTSTGYGSKIPTVYMLFHKGRHYRIYSMCYSNASTEYVIIKGEKYKIQL